MSYDLAARFRVAAALRAEAERLEAGREAEALPPFLPPLRAGAWFSALPLPDPLFLPPPEVVFTVARARLAATSLGTPRFS